MSVWIYAGVSNAQLIRGAGPTRLRVVDRVLVLRGLSSSALCEIDAILAGGCLDISSVSVSDRGSILSVLGNAPGITVEVRDGDDRVLVLTTRDVVNLDLLVSIFERSDSIVPPIDQGKLSLRSLQISWDSNKSVHLEAPGAHGSLTFGSGTHSAVFSALGVDASVSGLSGRFREVMLQIGLISNANTARMFDSWEHHDAAFFTATTWGLSDKHVGVGEALLPRDPRGHRLVLPSSHRVSLQQDDSAIHARRDSVLFDDVLANRRSRRDWVDVTSIDVVASLLSRSARVNEVVSDEVNAVSFRPSPSGGGKHPVDVFVATSDVPGLRDALYHYDPFDHVLEEVAGESSSFAIRASLAQTLATSSMPPLGVVFAARYQRLREKYDTICYSIILRDVGALYQTFYLVGESLDLSVCGVGSVNASIFAREMRVEPEYLAPVGAMAIGARAGVA